MTKRKTAEEPAHDMPEEEAKPEAEPDPQEETPAPEPAAASLRPAPRPVKRRSVHVSAAERT